MNSLGQVRIKVDFVGPLLDQPLQLVGWNRQPETAGPAVHELANYSFAALIQYFRLQVQASDRSPKRIATFSHSFFLPDLAPFSALRKAW